MASTSVGQGRLGLTAVGGIGGNNVSNSLCQSAAHCIDTDGRNRRGSTRRGRTIRRCGNRRSEHGSAMHLQRQLHSLADRCVKGQQDSRQVHGTAGVTPVHVGGHEPRVAPRSGGRSSVLWSGGFAGRTDVAVGGIEGDRPCIGRDDDLGRLWGPEHDVDSPNVPGTRPECLLSSDAGRIQLGPARMRLGDDRPQQLHPGGRRERTLRVRRIPCISPESDRRALRDDSDARTVRLDCRRRWSHDLLVAVDIERLARRARGE